MKGCSLLGAVGLCLLAVPALAGPFAEVPRSHDAYRQAAVLEKAGVLRPGDSQLLSSGKSLTRYDFALLVLEPLSALEAMAQDRPGSTAQTALVSALQNPDGEARRRLGRAIVVLAREFDDVLRLIGEDHAAGLRAAESLASTGSPGIRQPARNAGEVVARPALSYGVLGGTLALTYRRSEADAPPFEYVAALRLASPAGAAGAGSAATGGAPALGDLGLSAVGGSLEYGLSDDLRVRLGYEALLRHGPGGLTADPALLKTVGLAYRLSGSTDVMLRYQLIETRQAPTLAPSAARLAATELTVRF